MRSQPDNIPDRITAALRGPAPEMALNLLRKLPEGSVRDEECERVFGYSIKNGHLGMAHTIADECWRGQQRVEAHEKLLLESRKQSP